MTIGLSNLNKLQTTVNGIKFENPFILASGPPTASYESIKKGFEEGFSGAALKTIRPVEVENSNVASRFGVLKENNKIIGFENIEMISDESLLYWMETIKKLKLEFPNKVIIASIMGADKNTWQDVAIKMCSSGADALELNFSCPNGVTKQGLGLAIGQNTEAIKLITSWVKEVSNIPVIVKLTPNVTDIGILAKAAKDSGADAIAAINTVSSIIGVDIESLSPLPNVDGYTATGGYSGKAIKPIALRCVAEISKAVDIPVHGIGGVSNWNDAVEFISLGANVVQICTEVMLKGFSIIKPMLKGLSDYMERKSFESINSIHRIALNKIVSHSELNRKYIVFAEIDNSKCKKCLKCITICDESGYKSIRKNEKSEIYVDTNSCKGCSLCSHICTNDAIKMVKPKV